MTVGSWQCRHTSLLLALAFAVLAVIGHSATELFAAGSCRAPTCIEAQRFVLKNGAGVVRAVLAIDTLWVPKNWQDTLQARSLDRLQLYRAKAAGISEDSLLALQWKELAAKPKARALERVLLTMYGTDGEKKLAVEVEDLVR